MTRKTWIQIDGRLIPKDEYYGSNSRISEGLMVIGDIEPFVSPIDGKPVMSRKHLRDHNKLHDVCNYADFSPDYKQKKYNERVQRLTGQTKQDKQNRIDLIKRAMEERR